MNGPTIKKIAEQYKATPQQIIFAFARQMQMLPLTGTKDPHHMKQDLESLSLTLKEEELRTIEEIELIRD